MVRVSCPYKPEKSNRAIVTWFGKKVIVYFQRKYNFLNILRSFYEPV
jgi:hypothetical protein